MNNLLMPTEQKPETKRFTESVVLHPRFEEGFRAINMIHRSHSNRASGQMGMGMIMTGKPGVGKTRLLKFYRDSVQQHSDTRSLATVIIVETPAKRHVTNFYRAILEALGEKNLDRGPRLSTSDMESMILRLLESLGVELIIFDEAHNLLPRNGEGLTSTIANSIKQLMNKSKLPMIMVGEDETTELRKNQAAIRSRFAATFPFKPMDANELVHDEYTNKYVKNPYYLGLYLKELQERIQPECLALDTEDMVFRIFLATGGNPREVWKLITAVLEYSDLRKPLTELEFALGFDIAGSNPKNIGFNPFRAKSKKILQALGLER